MNEWGVVSVIVPVYNVEPYLDRCVQSIVDQTYSNIEILLVDDGSPDNCPAMCDAWAERDSRVKVIHQKNSGGGAARNAGLRIAAGDYIAFVDSDDYISPRMFEYLIGQFDDQTDIVECDYLTTDDDGAVFDDIESDAASLKYDRSAAMALHIGNRRFRQIIWNKLYRKSVAEGVFFPPGKRVDDEFWTYKAIGNARFLKSSPLRLYAYRQQSNSVMHQLSMEDRFQAIEAKLERLGYLEQNFPELTARGRVNIFFTCLYHGQLALKELQGDERREAIARLRETVKSVPPTKADLETLRLKRRFWACMAKNAFVLTCRLRNRLGVGK